MLFILSIVNLAMGLLMAGIGTPMAKGKIKPNTLYGFRTKKTLSDEKIWYPANAYAGKSLIYAGIATCILSAIFAILDKTTALFVNFSETAALIVFCIVLFVPIVVMTVACMMYLKKL
ncbi:MAG: SdpI family protein [Bacteroidota bacterium]